MALEGFVSCYADHVGTTVDAAAHDLEQIGEERIREFINFWRGLSDADRALVGLLFSLGGGFVSGVVLKMLTPAVGRVVALALIALAGVASWALLIEAFLACEDRL